MMKFCPSDILIVVGFLWSNIKPYLFQWGVLTMLHLYVYACIHDHISYRLLNLLCLKWLLLLRWSLKLFINYIILYPGRWFKVGRREHPILCCWHVSTSWMKYIEYINILNSVSSRIWGYNGSPSHVLVDIPLNQAVPAVPTWQ